MLDSEYSIPEGIEDIYAGAANAMERGCKALTLDPTTGIVAK